MATLTAGEVVNRIKALMAVQVERSDEGSQQQPAQ